MDIVDMRGLGDTVSSPSLGRYQRESHRWQNYHERASECLEIADRRTRHHSESVAGTAVLGRFLSFFQAA